MISITIVDLKQTCFHKKMAPSVIEIPLFYFVQNYIAKNKSGLY